MRCMISEPVPVLDMIGSRPAMMATTVIIFGRAALSKPILGVMSFLPASPKTPQSPGVTGKKIKEAANRGGVTAK